MHTERTLKRLFHAAFAVVAVLAILAAAVPAPAQAAFPAATCDETYVVKAGETIYRIARKYGMTANRLAKTNNLEAPYTLTAGQTLCIPDVAPVNTNASWTATYTEGNVKIVGSGFKKDYPFIVRVRENDTATWYKLGRFSTDDDGEISETFKLPKAVAKLTALNVCLKSAVNDSLVCKRVFRR